jgi:Na+/H+-translocating membrane pyrophosphatase
VADACRTGAATDIIFGLALGYKSTIIPCFVLAITIYIANSLAGPPAQSRSRTSRSVHAFSTIPIWCPWFIPQLSVTAVM